MNALSTSRGRALVLGLLCWLGGAGCQSDLATELADGPPLRPHGRADAGSQARADDDLAPTEDDDDSPTPVEGDDDVPSAQDDDLVDDDASDDDAPPPSEGEDAGLVEADDDAVPPATADAGVTPDAATPMEPELRLVSSEPAAGATDVAPDTGLVLEFNRDVRPGTGFVSLVEALSAAVVEAVPVSGDPRLSFRGAEVTVDWSTTLARATHYFVQVDPGAIEAVDGAAFAGLTEPGELAFTTVAADAIALLSTSPELGAVDVPLDTDLVLTFDAPVRAGQYGAVSVVDAASLTVVHSLLLGDTTVVTIDGATVTVDLPTDLAHATDYFVTLDAGAVQSVDGAAFDGFADDSVFAFSTVAPPEVTLVSTGPATGATEVDPNTPLVLTFSESVATGSGALSVFAVGNATAVEVVEVSDPGVALANDTVIVDLSSTLANATEYYVLVDPGFVLSQLGGRFVGIAAASEFTFTTAEAPPDPLLLVSTTPANGATSVPTDTDLELTFDQEVRVGAGNVAVYEADGDLFEAVSVTGAQVEVAGPTVTIDLAANLRGNTTYYVLIGAGSFESLTGGSFAGLSDVDAFRFTTEDTFGLVSLSPADDATGVDPAADLVLTFSEPVELGSGNIRVVRTSGAVVRESIALPDARVSVASNVVTVDLDGLLTGDTSYHVLVDSGAIRRAGGGNVYEGTSTSGDWNFTTGGVDEPGGVSAGLVLWLDADYAKSVKGTSEVRYWADRSGQANDVSNSATSERPARVTAAIGSRAVLRFDGSDDALYAATGLALTSVEGFIVWQSELEPDTDLKRSLLVNGENIEVNHSHPFVPNSVVVCAAEPCNTDAYYVASVNPPAAADTVTLWSFGFDSVTTSVFASAQGGAITFQPAPTQVAATPKTPLAIGGDSEGCTATDGCAYEGDIAEIVVYSRRLSQAERLAVVDYLRTKWGVPQVACGSGEVLADNGNCYYVQTGSSSWAAARDACVGRGGGWNLAAIRSQLDHDEVTALLSGAGLSDAWFGATDSEVADTWRWVTDTLNFWTGTSSGAAANGSYVNWRTGEPSAGSTEGCGRYNSSGGVWAWSDAPCDTAYPAICQGPGN